jgi:hypothetical protein
MMRHPVPGGTRYAAIMRSPLCGELKRIGKVQNNPVNSGACREIGKQLSEAFARF